MVTFADTGGLLHTLSLACGANRILELGTGAGHSTLSLARALPSDGMMMTMEIDAGCAGRARENLAVAGYSDRVTVMVGDATADPRLHTSFLPVGDGVSVSVKRAS